MSLLQDFPDHFNDPTGLDKRLRQQAALAQLGRHALFNSDLTGLLEEAVELVAQTLEVDYSSILELLPEENAMVMRASGGKWDKAAAALFKVSASPLSQSGYALSRKEPVVVPDFATETRFGISPIVHTHGVSSSASMVIEGQEHPFGVLNVHSVPLRDFTQHDLNFLSNVANLLGAVIQRRKAEQERDQLLAREQQARQQAEEATRQIQQLQAVTALLNTITTAAAGEDSLERILEITLQQLREVISFTGGSIALVEGEALVIKAAYGPFAAQAVGQGLPRGRGESRSWRVVEQGEPFLSNNLAREGLKATSPLRSYLAVPLRWRGRTFGLLEVDSTEPEAFKPGDLELMQKVATVLSGPIELAERYASEQRAMQREQQARALLDTLLITAPVGFGLWDTELRCVQVNPYLAAMNGLPVEAHLGKTLGEIVPHLAPEVEPYFRQVLETGQPVLDLEVQGARPSNPSEIRHALVSYYPVRTAEGQLLGIGLVVLDITERQQAEAERAELLARELAAHAEAEALAQDNARLYQEAQQAVRLRDEFLSIAAHELRTPITSLKGYAQLLNHQLARSGRLDPERLRQGLEVINRQSNKLTQLVGQLLEISRLETGRLELDLQRTDLRQLVEEVAASTQANLLTREEGPQHSIRVINPDPDQPLVAWVDPIRLEQVLINLVNNALKYSPPGGAIEIGLSLFEEEAEQRLQIRVRDWGVGVDPQHRPHLFERFYQARPSDASNGLGLGLYISQQIIQLHGGQIEAEFPDEGGSCFIITIPVQANHPDGE